MTPDESNDPITPPFESQLAALAPRLSSTEQQRMLYECAFAAGHRQARSALRKWQIAATVLGLALVGLAIPRPNASLVSEPVTTDTPLVVKQTLPVPLTAEEPPLAVRPRLTVKLDAWQIPESSTNRKTSPMASHIPSNLNGNVLTVGQLRRGLMF